MNSKLDRLRTLLILGRVSNLPTVWSNLLAGLFIAGEGIDFSILLPLLFGGSFLYVGGMYLNDFCDTKFDVQFCPQRPIPSGKISRKTVGWLASFWFVLGLLFLIPFGLYTTLIALILLATIVLYNFHHKNVAFAPLIMGTCRFLLYPLAASAVRANIPWYVLVLGATLGFYVAGITYLARGESRPEKPARWALLLLLLPVAVSVGIWLFVDIAVYPRYPFLPTRWPALLFFGLLFLSWTAWLLIPLWRKTNPSIGRVVSGLLAGIVLVDALMSTPVPFVWYGAWFMPLFILALLLQRVIPAT
jgi:hypothetical protein